MQIAFASQEEYQRWGLVFVESIKSDAELREKRQEVID